MEMVSGALRVDHKLKVASLARNSGGLATQASISHRLLQDDDRNVPPADGPIGMYDWAGGETP